MLNFEDRSKENIKIEDCSWYHIMDVPGLGLVDGLYDLRNSVEAILGNLNYKNKKVLNIGQSTGYLSFEAEKRGADVTSVDLNYDKGELIDWVINVKQENTEEIKNFISLEKRRRNAFWYAHKAFNSKSKLLLSNVNYLPEELEEQDIAIFLNMLLHLRDPFGALLKVCSRLREKIVITELGGYSHQNKVLKNMRKIKNFFFNVDEQPLLYFVPNDLRKPTKWWKFSPLVIINMLKLLGFEKKEVIYHYYYNNKQRKVFNFTIVAERKIPLNKCNYKY